MIASLASARAPIAELHNRFQEFIPVVQGESSTAFHNLRSVEDREDATAEATLTAWRRFLRAVTESVVIDPTSLARSAVESVARRLRRRSLLAA